MFLKLTRYGSIPKIGTFGKLEIKDRVFYTVEKPWQNNEPFKSCIPGGLYTLETHVSRKYGNTWAIVNESLGIYHNHDIKAERYACLIHAANWPRQVQGCIGVGQEIEHISGELGVTSSRASMDKLRELLSAGENHTLEIEGLYLPT